MKSHLAIARWVVALALACGAPALAQQPEQRPQPQPQQGAPRPGLQNPRGTPEHRRVAFLLGAWEEKIVYPGETEKDGTGRWFAQPVVGLYLSLRYDGSGPQGNYRAFGILAWDRDAQMYRMFWFDDAGGIGDYRGNFLDDNTLVLEHQSKVDGKDFREKITYTRVSATEVKTKIEQAWGGDKFTTYLEASATRTGDAPPPAPQRRPPDAPRP